MFKYVLLSAICLAFMSADIKAQQPPKLVAKEKYEETLKHYDSWHKNLSKPDFYEKFKWKTKDKEKKFSELTDFEKDQFYLVQGLQLTRELHVLSAAWQNEITWIQSGKIPDLPEGIATVEEITAFQATLLTLRKTTAVDFEKLLDSVFKEHKDKISDKERDYLKKQIVNFHNKNKLIERKDES